MSKFCVKCGAELEDHAAFCDDCGAQQVTSNPPPIPEQGYQPSMHTSSPENTAKHSGFGITALVLGIISFLTIGILIIPEILGIIFGIIGLLDKPKKTSLAIAGLVLSIFSILLFILFLFI